MLRFREVVLSSAKFIQNTTLIHDEAFKTRLIMSREELRELIKNWEPQFPDGMGDIPLATVSNCMNEICRNNS